jgi:fermentation-respiration switch protein FrsA (DUF1100 family)
MRTWLSLKNGWITDGMRRGIFAAIAMLAIFVIVPIGGALAYLKLNEADLVFRAAQARPWALGFTGVKPAGVHETLIPLPGGKQLRGFVLAPEPAADSGFWVLHLHGNADSAYSDGQFANVQRLARQGLSVLAFDYRGFGASPGNPSEEGLYQDADAAWRWLVAQGIRPDRIIIWGHSLGSGPATRLATQHSAAALVLFGAFTSVPDRAAELYPWLPVRWVAGIRFDSLSRMGALRVPVIIAHSPADLTIPYAHAERLFAAARQPKRLLRVEAQRNDGFGGHVTALYDQLEVLMPLLRELAGLPQASPSQAPLMR